MNRILVCIFLVALIVSCKKNNNTIVALQPFEGFDVGLLEGVAQDIAEGFNVKVIILKPIPLPKESFINVKSPRYRADKLIAYLKQEKPDSVDYIMGFTHRDISTTKKDKFGKVKEPESKYGDWGIFGLGYRPGPSSVVSIFRIQNTTDLKFEERLRKISLHEIGYNFGLKHCKTEKCVMQDAAESIKTIDRVSAELCANCKSLLSKI